MIKHVHKLELHKFFNFCAAHLPARVFIAEIPHFLFRTCLSKIRNTRISALYLAYVTGKCAAQKSIGESKSYLS